MTYNINEILISYDRVKHDFSLKRNIRYKYVYITTCTCKFSPLFCCPLFNTLFYTQSNFWHNSLDICFQILLDNPKMLFSLSRK